MWTTRTCACDSCLAGVLMPLCSVAFLTQQTSHNAEGQSIGRATLQLDLSPNIARLDYVASKADLICCVVLQTLAR